MNVAELIEELEKYPQDAVVQVFNEEVDAMWVAKLIEELKKYPQDAVVRVFADTVWEAKLIEAIYQHSRRE